MYIRNCNQQNIEYLKNDFININWQIVLSEMTDPSICYNNYINILNDIVNKNCPLIKKKPYTPNNSWLTNKLKNAIKKKNKLFCLYKFTNCMSILNRYTKLENKIKKNIKHD